ncbi:MAG: hypothetical protein ABI572_05885 [Actinomycetota bacterium]
MPADAPAPTLEEPVWFERLRKPTWLLPAPRADAVRVAFASEHPEGAPERDLAIGLPLFLAEAVRFATEADTVAMTEPVAPGAGDLPARLLDASLLVMTSLRGTAEARRLSLRVDRPAGVIVDVEIDARDGPELAEALADLPRRVTDAVRTAGVPGTWAPVYAPPGPSHALRYVQAHRACLELGADALYPPADDDPEIVSARRTVVKALLGALGDFAQRARGAFPTMLYFAGLAGAHAHGSNLPLDFRLQTNALCMGATDTRDIAYRLSTLVLRLQGDVQIADRRAVSLEGAGDRALAAWLGRVKAVR